MAEVSHTLNDQRATAGTLAAQNDTLTVGRFTTWGAVGVQLAGTWTGTVTFEASADGANWQTISMTPSNSTVTVTSTTANGLWFTANIFFAQYRVRFSTATSGSVSATIVSRTSQF